MSLITMIRAVMRIFRYRLASETERIAFHTEVQHGDEVRLTGDVDFGSEPFLIRIGSRVTIADGVRFVTHDGAVRVLRDKDPTFHVYGPITIGSDVFIGVGATILPNVSIGNNSIVGAGSVVTKSIPSGEVWAGVPARMIKTIDEYYLTSLPRNFPWKPGNYGPEWREALREEFGA